MRKVTTLVAAAAVVLAFTACNKTNNVTPEFAEGTTYAKLTVTENATRLNEGQANADGVGGVGGESLVKTGVLFTRSAKIDLASLSPFTLNQAQADVENGGKSAWVTDAFKYDGIVGQDLQTGVVLNATGITPALAAGNFQENFTVGIDQLGTLASKDGFTMSSKTTVKNTIKEGVAKADVDKEGNGENRLDFTVERVASKVQVSKAATVNKEGSGLSGEFSNQRYSVAGSAKKVYLFGDKAGTRTLDTTDGVYKNFTSAIHDVDPTTFEGNKIKKARDLQKVSDGIKNGTEDLKNVVAPNADGNDSWDSYHSLVLGEDQDYKTTSNAKGIYFLENSLNKTINGKGQLMYNDIVYVKVYATYTPAANEVIKSGTASTKYEPATAEDFSKAQEYVVPVTKEFYDAHSSDDKYKDILKSETTGEEGSQKTTYTLSIKDEAGTFYLGTETNKLYLTSKAALDDGNTTCKMYKKGRMYWRVPANSQLGEGFVKYADTRRNNIYSLQVTDILGIGGNYDPIDPDDPNIEKPDPKDNPNEPEPDEKEEVNPKENSIKVQVAILQWNLVHRGIKLGE